MLKNLRQVHVPGGILDMRTIYLASHLQKRKSYCHLFSPCLSSSHMPALVPGPRGSGGPAASATWFGLAIRRHKATGSTTTSSRTV